MRRTNPNFLNGVPELVVLSLLARQDMYGYELVKAIQEKTREAFTFGEGCVYPVLHYLEETRLVSSARREVGGRTRTYYRLSARGQKRLESLTQDWKQVSLGISLALGEHTGERVYHAEGGAPARLGRR